MAVNNLSFPLVNNLFIPKPKTMCEGTLVKDFPAKPTDHIDLI